MSGFKFHIPRGDSAQSYAYRCASYIKSAERVQTLTRRAYGVEVSLAWIEACMKHHATKSAYGVNVPDEVIPDDGQDFRVKSLVAQVNVPAIAKPVAPKPQVAKPAPVVVLAPTMRRRDLFPRWYRPACLGRLTAMELIHSVARDFGISASDLRSDGRKGKLVEARAVVARILKDRGLSYPQVGRLLGGRDHSTTINMARNFDIYARRNGDVTRSYLRHRAMDAMHNRSAAA